MSKVDDIFIEDLKAILEEDWEDDNRAEWKDGSLVQTKRILQVTHKYDLSKGFPIMSLRNINWRASIEEIIWIMIKLSNNVDDLKTKIWESWANEDREIEKAYGYQIAKPTMGYSSQIEYVIEEIKRNPTSRRIMMNMFDAKEQEAKAEESLIECAYATHFSVKKGKLHMTLVQRSGDFLTACGFGGWNVTQYAFLQHAIAQECGLEVGIFAHVIQDLHLYNHHTEQAYEMLARYEKMSTNEQNTVQIKIANKPFFELTVDDVEMVGYVHMGDIEKLDVAV